MINLNIATLTIHTTLSVVLGLCVVIFEIFTLADEENEFVVILEFVVVAQ